MRLCRTLASKEDMEDRRYSTAHVFCTCVCGEGGHKTGNDYHEDGDDDDDNHVIAITTHHTQRVQTCKQLIE